IEKEEGRGVGRPPPAPVDTGHRVWKIIATRQILEPQLVDLVTGTVDRVGEQPTVRADRAHAKLYVRRRAGDLVQVEEHLDVVRLGSDWAAAELAELPVGVAATDVERINFAPGGRALCGRARPLPPGQ